MDNIEDVVGSAFDDIIAGDDKGNFILGLDGKDQISGQGDRDTILGGSGIDNLFGNDGDDRLIGGSDIDFLRGDKGDDFLDGGSGEDAARYETDPSGVVVFLSTTQGVATDGYGNTDTLISIEDVRGSAFDDIITGDEVSNTIRGNGGNDNLVGGGGDDDLIGGDGFDLLEGNSGKDDFRYGSVSEIGDSIVDFTPADDEFLISNSGFPNIDFGPSGTLSSEKFVVDTVATEPTHRVVYNAEVGLIYIDPDGKDGQPQQLFAILLNQPPDLTADNFFIG